MKNKNVDQSHQNTRVSVDHTKIERVSRVEFDSPCSARRFLFILSWIIKVRANIKKNTPNVQDHRHLIHITKLPKKQGQLRFQTHPSKLKLVLSRHCHLLTMTKSFTTLFNYMCQYPYTSRLSPILIPPPVECLPFTHDTRHSPRPIIICLLLSLFHII